MKKKAGPLVLTGSQRRYLRGLAHGLEPIIQVGHKGQTDTLIKELDQALTAHELVKVRLNRHAPDDLSETAEALAAKTGAAVAQLIGHVMVLYRPAPEPEDRKITLPKPRKGETAHAAEKAEAPEVQEEALEDEDEIDEGEEEADEDEGFDEGDSDDDGGFDWDDEDDEDEEEEEE